MYGTDDGPFMAPTGESYILADIHVTLEVPDEYNDVEQDIWMSFNFHSTPEWHQEEDGEVTFCESHQAIRRARKLDPSGTVHIFEKYHVQESSKQFMSFAFCGITENCPSCSVSFDGSFIFKNPYGFLRAAEFGLLPFSTSLCLAYTFSTVLFAIMFWRNLDAVHTIQKMVLSVLLLCTVSSFVWLATYYDRNSNGVPECCPYSNAVIVSHVFEILSIASIRVLILCVCLGFGVEATPFNKGTRVKITLLTLFQFVVSVIATALDTQEKSHARYDTTEADSNAAFFYFLAKLGEIVYIVWVWSALTNTMKKLERNSQTYKLAMYQQLRGGLMCIVMTYIVVEILQIMAAVQALQWAWDAAWLLNPAIFWWSAQFAAVLILCWIWRPNPTASLYASSSQLPQSDDEADRQNIAETDAGLEMTSVAGNDGEEDSSKWQAEMGATEGKFDIGVVATDDDGDLGSDGDAEI